MPCFCILARWITRRRCSSTDGLAGRHVGGYTPFSFDVTALLRAGENTVTVYARDDVRSGAQPAGKQSVSLASAGCYYTRTTGIWQTVWLEFVPRTRIAGLYVTPDARNGKLDFTVFLCGDADGCTLRVRALSGGAPGRRDAAEGWRRGGQRLACA